MNNLFSVTPSQAKKFTELCMKAHLVPFLQSSPGMGKSSIVKQIAKEYDLELIDCRLSTMEPTDLNGLPWFNNGKAEFQPYSFFPFVDTPIPEGKQGWLLFLDEFNSAARATQAAAYRVVLDHEIGQKKLHPECYVVAAGNKMTDGAITNKLSTAMSSRVIHLNMEISFDDWMDFAVKNQIDEKVLAYLSMYPDKLMVFDPDKDEQTFTCPRTWEFVSKLIQANGGKIKGLTEVLAGAITGSQASTFVQFCNVYADLVTIQDIIRNPDIPCPSDKATQFAIMIHLTNKTDVQNLPVVIKWAKKNFVPTIALSFLRNLNSRYSSLDDNPLLGIPEYVENMQELSKYMMG